MTTAKRDSHTLTCYTGHTSKQPNIATVVLLSVMRLAGFTTTKVRQRLLSPWLLRHWQPWLDHCKSFSVACWIDEAYKSYRLLGVTVQHALLFRLCRGIHLSMAMAWIQIARNAPFFQLRHHLWWTLLSVLWVAVTHFLNAAYMILPVMLHGVYPWHLIADGQICWHPKVLSNRSQWLDKTLIFSTLPYPTIFSTPFLGCPFLQWPKITL